MVDLNALAPSEMARLLGKPEGEAGRAVGERLNRVNAEVTTAGVFSFGRVTVFWKSASATASC